MSFIYSLIADCCYKILEDPVISAAKMKYMRETVFQVLGILIKRYNHGLSCSVKIVYVCAHNLLWSYSVF
jgi:condensin complex subunit 1